jgi:hypothetical protein
MPIKKEIDSSFWDSEQITFPPSPAEFMPKIIQAWLDEQDLVDKPRAVDGTLWRASSFGNPCDLSVRKYIDGEPKSNPPGISGLYRMGLGTAVHNNLQRFVEKAFPGCQVEVAVDFRPELDGSGSADFIIEYEGQVAGGRTLLELKTIGGFGFKKAAAPFKGGPEGPKLGHMHQGAIEAEKLDCDRMVIGYVSMEAISADLARKMGVDEIGKITAEWHFDRNEIAILARDARERANRVLTEYAAGIPTPPRVWDFDIPVGAVIVEKGKWITEVNGKRTNVGTTWACGYCDYRDVCDVPG